MARTPLTSRRLEAIVEALTSRLAGEIDISDHPDAPEAKDYEKALAWADDELAKRQSRNAKAA